MLLLLQVEKKVLIFSFRFSEPDERDINHDLGTVGLGAVSPLDLAFQVSLEDGRMRIINIL